ncbi:MAG: MBL fold metallo-hydrolase [Actinobacteria bacterium]|nr:MBL fold metallo-hydrolase [Actinomycetota bacterium]
MGQIYTKQEQEPASEDVIEVAPGILRMQLPISMPGLGHVNCYALIDGDGVALVDPGLPGKDSWDALMRRLAQAEIPLERVHTTIVTHSHPDHFGGSAQLHEVAGAEILTHESFVSFSSEASDDMGAEALTMSDDEILQLWKTRMESEQTAWGTSREAPPDDALLRFIRDGARDGQRFLTPEPMIRVADNAVMRFADRDWFGVHTPGHTTDHLCLWDPEQGVLLSGDHVLPTITPHIAGSTELEDPLATFFASLDRIAALEGVTAVLPAHGHPMDEAAQRCDHIKVHHDERLDVLRDAAEGLGDAPVDEWMKVLFRERSWGGMAASETYAHLEHLRVLGEAATRRNADGLLFYELSAT